MTTKTLVHPNASFPASLKMAGCQNYDVVFNLIYYMGVQLK